LISAKRFSKAFKAKAAVRLGRNDALDGAKACCWAFHGCWQPVAALKENPPAPFDLSVKTRVFSTKKR